MGVGCLLIFLLLSRSTMMDLLDGTPNKTLDGPLRYMLKTLVLYQIEFTI